MHVCVCECMCVCLCVHECLDFTSHQTADNINIYELQHHACAHTHTHQTHTHIKDIRSQAWLYTILSLLSPSQVERRTMHTQYTTKHSLSFPSDCSLHPLLPATLFIRAKMMTKLKCLEGKNISMFEHCSTKKNILKLYIIENCSTHTEEKKNLEGKKKITVD